MLTNIEIQKVVSYIGVNGGYLGNFSYRTHAEFYPEYCDLDIDPDELSGTTRERFIHILESQIPANQLKILKGVLEKYPLDSFREEERERKSRLYEYILGMVRKLEGMPIDTTNVPITSETVRRALDDAKTLIEKNGATSGLDRVHTTLHGYLKSICEDNGIQINSKNPSITEIFKELRKHSKLQIKGSRSEDSTKILNSMATIVDSLNPIRNMGSVAHPNKELLEEDEAMLAIKCIQYNSKLFKFKI